MTTEDLIQALQEVITVTRIHDDARDRHKGCSWDYFGYDFIKDRDNAQQKFSDVLEKYIEEKIASVLLSGKFVSQGRENYRFNSENKI